MGVKQGLRALLLTSSHLRPRPRPQAQRVYLALCVLIFIVGLPLGALFKLIQLKPHLDVLGAVEKEIKQAGRAEEK